MVGDDLAEAELVVWAFWKRTLAPLHLQLGELTRGGGRGKAQTSEISGEASWRCWMSGGRELRLVRRAGRRTSMSARGAIVARVTCSKERRAPISRVGWRRGPRRRYRDETCAGPAVRRPSCRAGVSPVETWHPFEKAPKSTGRRGAKMRGSSRPISTRGQQSAENTKLGCNFSRG